MVIDEDGVVLAGNGLLETLRRMDTSQAACLVVAGLTDNEKKKLMLADNRIAALGEEDQFAFEEALRDLSGDIDIPGYGAEILKNLATDLKNIEDLTVEQSEPVEKKRQPKARFCTCPHCGFTFNYNEAKINGNQNP